MPNKSDSPRGNDDLDIGTKTGVGVGAGLGGLGVLAIVIAFCVMGRRGEREARHNLLGATGGKFSQRRRKHGLQVQQPGQVSELYWQRGPRELP